MKLCKDCNYFRSDSISNNEARCHHFSASTAPADMVFGRNVYYTCKAMRESKDPCCCGPLAIFFNPLKEI